MSRFCGSGLPTGKKLEAMMNSVALTLNDKLIIDDAQLPGVPRKGPLALQVHPERKDGEWGTSLVQFRNIRIKELTDAK